MPRGNEYVTKVNRDVGSKIKELRISKGWGMDVLAEKIDVTHQQVYKYENGTNAISCGRLKNVAEVFDVSVGYFFDEENAPPLTETQRIDIEAMRNFQKLKTMHLKEAANELIKAINNHGE